MALVWGTGTLLVFWELWVLRSVSWLPSALQVWCGLFHLDTRWCLPPVPPKLVPGVVVLERRTVMVVCKVHVLGVDSLSKAGLGT